MTTIFEGTKTYHGLSGDRAYVNSVEDRVLVRCVDTMAEEAVVVAFSPEQARELATAIIAATDKAEAADD